MSALPEFVGTIHIFRGPCRGNPIGLYLRQEGDRCSIAPTATPWDRVVGVGETPNKAAADFDAKWKVGEVDPEMYSGPHWEGGIKPEKPKPPPKPPTAAKPDAAVPSPPPTAATPDAAEQPQPGAAATASASPPPPNQVSRAVTAPPPSAPASSPAEGASDPPDAPPSQSTPSAQDDPAPPEHNPNHAS